MKRYNNGMAVPLSDKDYYNLMTDNGRNAKLVAIVVRCYPELAAFTV